MREACGREAGARVYRYVIRRWTAVSRAMTRYSYTNAQTCVDLQGHRTQMTRIT